MSKEKLVELIINNYEAFKIEHDANSDMVT